MLIKTTNVSRSPPETLAQGAGTDSHGWTWEEPVCRLEPVAPSPWRWRDLGFLFEFRHVGVVALRVTISHSGRALVPEKGQRMSFLGSMISLIPPCIQPPDCQRFATVCPNSHSAPSYTGTWVHRRLGVYYRGHRKRPSYIRPTFGNCFKQMQHWGNSGETGWSAYGLSRAHRYHLELK